MGAGHPSPACSKDCATCARIRAHLAKVLVNVTPDRPDRVFFIAVDAG